MQLIGTMLIHRHTEKSALGSTIVIYRWVMMGRRCSPLGFNRTNVTWRGGKVAGASSPSTSPCAGQMAATRPSERRCPRLRRGQLYWRCTHTILAGWELQGPALAGWRTPIRLPTRRVVEYQGAHAKTACATAAISL